RVAKHIENFLNTEAALEIDRLAKAGLHTGVGFGCGRTAFAQIYYLQARRPATVVLQMRHIVALEYANRQHLRLKHCFVYSAAKSLDIEFALNLGILSGIEPRIGRIEPLCEPQPCLGIRERGNKTIVQTHVSSAHAPRRARACCTSSHQ